MGNKSNEPPSGCHVDNFTAEEARSIYDTKKSVAGAGCQQMKVQGQI